MVCRYFVSGGRTRRERQVSQRKTRKDVSTVDSECLAASLSFHH